MIKEICVSAQVEIDRMLLALKAFKITRPIRTKPFIATWSKEPTDFVLPSGESIKQLIKTALREEMVTELFRPVFDSVLTTPEPVIYTEMFGQPLVQEPLPVLIDLVMSMKNPVIITTPMSITILQSGGMGFETDTEKTSSFRKGTFMGAPVIVHGYSSEPSFAVCDEGWLMTNKDLGVTFNQKGDKFSFSSDNDLLIDYSRVTRVVVTI